MNLYNEMVVLFARHLLCLCLDFCSKVPRLQMMNIHHQLKSVVHDLDFHLDRILNGERLRDVSFTKALWGK